MHAFSIVIPLGHLIRLVHLGIVYSVCRYITSQYRGTHGVGRASDAVVMALWSHQVLGKYGFPVEISGLMGFAVSSHPSPCRQFGIVGDEVAESKYLHQAHHNSLDHVLCFMEVYQNVGPRISRGWVRIFCKCSVLYTTLY